MWKTARARRPSPGTVLGGLAVVIATSGVAVAAIPGSGQVVTVCFGNSGALRVIDAEAGETCGPNQTAVRLASVDQTGKVRAAAGADQAANADTLDGKDSSAFLGTGTAAGGDLTGSYPSPSVGTGRVTSSHIADGSIATGDLAGSAVTTGNIASGAVTPSKLSDGFKAPDADRLDGNDSADLVSDGCSAGYVEVGPLCWEASDRYGFTFAGAANRCRTAGGRVPTLAEFLALASSGVDLGQSVLHDWTSDPAGDDQAIYINQVSGTNIDGVQPHDTISFARCVKDPVNALGSP